VADFRIDKNELIASICRDSFYDFVQTFWPEVIAEDPVWNWHIKYLCDVMQESAERVFVGEKKKHETVVNIPPGTTKSTIASIMFPMWVWTRMPTARTICASYSYPLAMDLSRKSRDIIKSDLWLELFPDIKLRVDQDTKGHFINTHGGSRFAVGTNSTVTGMHSHFIIIDDPINPHKAFSEKELNTANRYVCETLSTRKVDKAVTVTFLIMQRLHQNDPSAQFLKKAEGKFDVLHINLPAEITEATRADVQPAELLGYYEDGLLDPVRLSRDVLQDLRAALGEYGYAGQMLQRPVPLGGGMFKFGRIHIEISPPAHPFYRQKVRYWDKAGTGGGGAWTVGVLMGWDHEARFWILDVVRGQWESAARETIIKQTANIDTRKVIIGVEQEPGSGGKESAQNTVRNLAGFRVRVDRPTGNKIIRADPFSVQVNAGNVYLKKGPWNRDFLQEIQHFPYSTNKDQVDASAGAFNLLTKPVIRVGALS